MNRIKDRSSVSCWFGSRFAYGVLAFLMGALPVQYAQAEVSQIPLFLGGGSVPGNMVLVPSVEWPTIESVANLDNDYSHTKTFAGYFDSDKCYRYDDDDSEPKRHFYPSSMTSNHQCTGGGEWSGNFLNWALTQTVDPFRKVLTGGLRVKDTPTETWLEKARHPGQGSGFPIRDLKGWSEVKGATPFNAGRIRVRVKGLGVKARFSVNDYDYNEDVEPYEPDDFESDENQGWEISARVKVCDASVGVEENCKPYSNGWKPEGLIQQNAKGIRYSVFGYLNDSSTNRDGGVLRAAQKYVGPERFKEGEGFVSNPAAEWDAETGVLVRNPDSAAASATASFIEDSGVINYLNKFGQLNDGNNKSKDPVSELYYAATRYLKNLGNVSEYSSMAGGSGSDKKKWLDGFPVIEDWEDPIEYECQANVLLGIGDANTHRDKDVPGNTAYRADEDASPQEIKDDKTVDARAATNKVGALEGLGAIGNGNSFTGRNNSAYIAGLAYDNHTVDMRPDLAGMQTASTHWVDVLENQALLPPEDNQYYLATKYGGFVIPDDVDFKPYERTDPLPEDWWHTNTDVLSIANMKRPDNYYLAGKADRMIESLRDAFKNITAELSSSAASVAASSTSLETDTTLFQASFDSSAWSGDLLAFDLTDSGDVATAPSWSAAAILDAVSDFSSRNILTADPLSLSAQAGDALLTTTGKPFIWSQLSDSQKAKLRQSIEGPLVTENQGEQRVDFLRGDRSREKTTGNQTQPFRMRNSRLGDIVNSNPQYVYQDNFGYQALSSLAAYQDIESYSEFRASDEYKNREPLLLVGANDGMLHGFDAQASGPNAGKELFAYVPASIYSDLWTLTSPDYEHQYFVDGTPRVADAWLGNTLKWRTIAVGTTGAGGKSVFALDISDSANMSASDVLWEFSHADLGRTIQQPPVIALANGKFGVVVSSGYDSTADNGYIWILDAATGEPIKKFELAGSGELGSPLAVDLDYNRVADRIYVGDTDGKLWRIDIDGASVMSWGVPTTLMNGTTPKPLFQADDKQPITAQLSSAFNEQGEHMVFFGTGSFFRIGENVLEDSPPKQSFYGIIDYEQPSKTLDRSDLLSQSILGEGQTAEQRYRVVSDNQPQAGDKGWYLDLVVPDSDGNMQRKGERVVSRALVRGDRVIFSTLIPSEDPCSAGGDSWLMELNTFTGSRLDYSVFDVNNDGSFDADDKVTVIIDGEEVEVPTSGVGSEVGIFGTATVVDKVPGGEAGSNELKVVSGSSGKMVTIPEAGSANIGRESWQQYR